MTAASYGRQTRQLTRSLAGAWSGKERGPDRKVRRESYDVDDRRAQVFRPIGDGTVAGALGWIDCLLKTVSEWDDLERRKGGARPLGFAGLRVLETIVGRRGGIPIDFKTGRIDPAIDTIARVARLTRTTVIRALARLKAMKILDWVRRTRKTGNAGNFGPQREQVSNAYCFDLSQLPARVRQRFRDLLARWSLRRRGISPKRPDQGEPDIASIRDPALRATLEGLADTLGYASPPSGQYPRSEQG